jgi:hypothetical protein
MTDDNNYLERMDLVSPISSEEKLHQKLLKYALTKI